MSHARLSESPAVLPDLMFILLQLLFAAKKNRLRNEQGSDVKNYFILCLGSGSPSIHRYKIIFYHLVGCHRPYWYRVVQRQFETRPEKEMSRWWFRS